MNNVELPLVYVDGMGQIAFTTDAKAVSSNERCMTALVVLSRRCLEEPASEPRAEELQSEWEYKAYLELCIYFTACLASPRINVTLRSTTRLVAPEMRIQRGTALYLICMHGAVTQGRLA